MLVRTDLAIVILLADNSNVVIHYVSRYLQITYMSKTLPKRFFLAGDDSRDDQRKLPDGILSKIMILFELTISYQLIMLMHMKAIMMNILMKGMMMYIRIIIMITFRKMSHQQN